MDAIDELIASLRTARDYQQLFYARLMQARVRLGVSPFPSGPSSELPEHIHEPYEQAIREAAREVGQLYIAEKDLPRAWGYYRLIAEPEPIRAALDAVQLGEDDDVYPLLDIAWHQRIHPHRGFDLLLAKLGICSAITTLSTTDLSNDPPLRVACIRKLVAALHEQLIDRLTVHAKDLGLPPGPLLRDELFADGSYHVDVSHLSSVVQMALELPPGDALLPQARELCTYGERLDPSFRTAADSPFEDSYADYGKLLDILGGVHVDEGLKHFETKAAAEAADNNTFPAEVFVNLLVKLDRKPEALVAARKYLPNDGEFTCPSAMTLARDVKDYATVADLANERGDKVTELAAKLASQ